MNVLVDRERMVFLYAHESRQVLNDIMRIECWAAHTCLFECEPSAFGHFTDLELKLLYKHTTGTDHSVLSRPQLMQVLADIGLRLTPLACHALELFNAANCIKPGDDESYRYMKGSAKPVPQVDLFTPAALRTPRSEQEEQAARTALRAPGAVAWPWQGDRAGIGTSTPAKAPRAPSAVTAPKGGVREIIWGVADRLWQEAGSPTNVQTVLVLRKRMMTELEAMGVKRNSASNELGNWQKFHLKNS